MSDMPPTIIITLRARIGAGYTARIVGWGNAPGGKYGSLWSVEIPRIGEAGDSSAFLLSQLAREIQLRVEPHMKRHEPETS